MTELAIDWMWAGPHRAVSQFEMARACAISEAELDELVEYGALLPLPRAVGSGASEPRMFMADCVTVLHTACELRRHFDLDLFTITILMDYLHRIGDLEDHVSRLQAQLSTRTLIEPLG